MQTVRTAQEVDEVYEAARNTQSIGTKFSGMTYEEGIIATIEWLKGESFDNPMED